MNASTLNDKTYTEAQVKKMTEKRDKAWSALVAAIHNDG